MAYGIEITNHCNYSCSFCLNPIMKRKREHMDKDLFVKILDELSGFTKNVVISGYGEPLLHPLLLEFLDELRGRPFQTVITTNGSLLNNGILDAIVASKISKLIISTQSFFNMGREYHKKAIFNAINYFYIKKPKAMLTLRYWFPAEHNVINKRFGEYPVVSSAFIQFINEFTDSYGIQRIDKKKLLNEPIPNTSFLLFGKVQLSLAPLQEKKFPDKGISGDCHCTSILNGHFILSNGDFVLCCEDYEGKIFIGNVKKQTIASILNSGSYEEAMAHFNEGKPFSEYCLRCIARLHPIERAIRNKVGKNADYSRKILN